MSKDRFETIISLPKNYTGTKIETPAKWDIELRKLEQKRLNLHNYITMKLEEQDYHGVADAAMDLRELDARSKAIKEWLQG